MGVGDLQPQHRPCHSPQFWWISWRVCRQRRPIQRFYVPSLTGTAESVLEKPWYTRMHTWCRSSHPSPNPIWNTIEFLFLFEQYTIEFESIFIMLPVPVFLFKSYQKFSTTNYSVTIIFFLHTAWQCRKGIMINAFSFTYLWQNFVFLTLVMEILWISFDLAECIEPNYFLFGCFWFTCCFKFMIPFHFTQVSKYGLNYTN